MYKVNLVSLSALTNYYYIHGMVVVPGFKSLLYLSLYMSGIDCPIIFYTFDIFK